MCKNWFVGGVILHDHNEKIATFSNWKNFLECFFLLFIFFGPLFCNYEREVGMELILYVCCLKH